MMISRIICFKPVRLDFDKLDSNRLGLDHIISSELTKPSSPTPPANNRRRRDPPFPRRFEWLDYEVSGLVFEDWCWFGSHRGFHGVFHDPHRFLYDKVTVLESEKRAWEGSAEGQAYRDALNPWKKLDEEAQKKS